MMADAELALSGRVQRGKADAAPAGHFRLLPTPKATFEGCARDRSAHAATLASGERTLLGALQLFLGAPRQDKR